MPLPRLRPVLFAALALASAAPPLAAQSRDRWYEEERRDRERERRRDEARREAERRAERARHDAQMRAHELRMRLEHDRLERERRARREQQRYHDRYRPRLALGGGIDLRQFGGDERYFVQGGVDFRGRSGFGVRPEVLFGWTERAQDQQVAIVAPGGVVTLPGGQSIRQGRSRMLGVAVSGTYTAGLGRSPVRPYVMSGIGVFSTRAPSGFVAVNDAIALPVGQPVLPINQPQLRQRFVNSTNIGLTAGAGLEVDVGPVRLFGELRYLLVDQPRPLGFSGALPLTIGLKL